MLGRGIVADPALALAIKRHLQSSTEHEPAWEDLLPLVADFWELVGTRTLPHHRAGRLKQWLNFLRRRHPQAQELYAALRTVNDPALVERELSARCAATEPGRTRLAA